MLSLLVGRIPRPQNNFIGDMMTFKCLKCRKVIEDSEDRVRCPFCGYRIFSKMRPEVVKKIQAK